jgi:hypothetical protein
MAGTGYRTVESAVGADGASPQSRKDSDAVTLYHVTNDWLVTVIVADLTQRPVFLEERPDMLIPHPQRDALSATPAVDLEIDHRTVFPLVKG